MIEAIDATLATLFDKPTPLFTSARYALIDGKRLRPQLLLATAATYGCQVERALRPACAWELVHTYSLIHDDLPCMDNDDERRGKPSLHRAYPQWQAILTGDFFLTFAFELLATSEGLSPPLKIGLIKLLAKNSGSEGMLGGQVLDLSLDPKSISLKQLCELHSCKTGALIASAVEAGGLIAAAGQAEMEKLRALGHCLGLGYQIADDLLDEGETGPSVLSILSKNEAENWLNSLHEKTTELLSSLAKPAPLLKELAGKMLQHGNPIADDR